MKLAYGEAPAGRNAARPSGALIDDDHRLFCEALVALLRATLNVDAIETAGSLAEALERLRRAPAPDLVLVEAPIADRVTAHINLKDAAPGAAIVVVSAPNEDRTLVAVLRIGSGALSFAAAEARAGAPYGPETYPPPRTNDQAAPGERDAAHLLKSLTRQQARILELVCEGKFNKQIAYSLDISEGTVKAHLTAILRKLNARNRTQAVLIARNARFAPIRSWHASGQYSLGEAP